MPRSLSSLDRYVPILAGTHCLLSPSLLSAQNIKTQGAASGAEVPKLRDQLPWFNDPDVRAQIKMSNDQYKRLSGDYVRFRTRYDRALAEIEAERDEAARRARVLSALDEYDRDLTKSLDSVLTDRISRRRYDQLYRQYQGYSALHTPSIQKQLALTAQQKAKIAEYEEDWDAEYVVIRQEFEKDRPAAMRHLKHARRDIEARIIALLTPEQTRLWSELTGDRYEFSTQAWLPPVPSPGLNSTEVVVPVEDEPVSPLDLPDRRDDVIEK